MPRGKRENRFHRANASENPATESSANYWRLLRQLHQERDRLPVRRSEDGQIPNPVHLLIFAVEFTICAMLGQNASRSSGLLNASGRDGNQGRQRSGCPDDHSSGCHQ